MSVRVMSLVWSLDLPASQKIVLLALADCANDEGHAWPGMASLTVKCSKSERTIQGVLIELEKAGHITRKQVPGKGCNYYIHPNSTPADSAPRKSCAPQKPANTPAESAGKPSRTINNGLSNDKPSCAIKRKGWPEIPSWIPAEAWNGFVKMRDGKRSSLTPRAVTLLIAKLDGMRAKGHDPGTILDTSTEHGWTGIFEPKAPKNERTEFGRLHPRPASDGAARALDRQLGLGEFAGEAGRCDPREGTEYFPRAIAGPGTL